MISSGLNSCVGIFCESDHDIMMKFQTDPDHEESQREGRQVVGILNGGAVERKVGVKTNPLPFSYWAAISGLRVETLTDPGDIKKCINVLIQLQRETCAGWCTAPLTLRTRLLLLEILKKCDIVKNISINFLPWWTSKSRITTRTRLYFWIWKIFNFSMCDQSFKISELTA